MIKHVLFDLDGTLADTAPDLAYALNAVRQAHGMAPLPLDSIRPVISLGGPAMIKLAFDLKEEDEGFATIRDEFLNIYRENIAIDSALFDGMETVLNLLDKGNISWGIVTNKMTWLTLPLLKALQLDKRTNCIVCGDTTEFRKPHPQPVTHACGLLGAEPEQTVYIGDAERDIESGRRAGTKTVVALYGYIEKDSDPEQWQASAMVHNPLEINDIIDQLC